MEFPCIVNIIHFRKDGFYILNNNLHYLESEAPSYVQPLSNGSFFLVLCYFMVK
jgi:hypothetical protein